MALGILDVDLLAFGRGGESAREAVVDGVRQSLATGFVTSSHNLSTDLLDQTYGLLRTFFHLPAESKQRFHRADAHGQTGYTGVLVETAAQHNRADWKEMLNWSAPLERNHPLRRAYPLMYPEALWPEEALPGLTETLSRFHEAMADFQRRFLRVISLALGAAEPFFEDMVPEGPTLTRALRYPPMEEAPAEGHVWAAPHADINLLTALPRASGPGLEVWLAEQWRPVIPPEGHVILNTGLMLERLSNGRFPSGWHRVVAPEGSQGERLSVVQFCHPRPSTVLAPLPCCCQSPTPQRYAAVSAADALEDVLYRINLLKPATTG